MKITGFNPLIVTPRADEVIALFEALGFEKRHITENDSEISTYSSVRMKNADGFSVGVLYRSRETR